MKEFVISEAQVETAILVGLITQTQDERKTKEYLDELEFLAETAGATVVKRFTQKLPAANSVTYVGKGKLEEIKEYVAERKENTETEIEEYAKKEPEKPVNTQKFEKQTSGSLKNKLQEVSKTNFKEFEKQTSRSLENKLQEVSKTNCNNTEYNYTEFSENESYQYLSEQEKGRDRIQERNEYRQLIHDNIEYEILCQSYGTGRVEELVELMLDAICSTKTYQQINGEAVPTQVVKSRLLKVGYEHIQYVFFSLDRSTSKVKNIRQYMLTVLYNAPATINQFYDAEVRHDMYWGKDIPDR